MTRSVRAVIEKTPDLTADFYGACTGQPVSEAVYAGAMCFDLGGLYHLALSHGVLEIEFTDTVSLRRSVIRLSENYPVFIRLPVSSYRMYYRPLSGFSKDKPASIFTHRSGFTQGLALYARKVLNLRRLSSRQALRRISMALKTLKNSRTAVGLSAGDRLVPPVTAIDYSSPEAPPPAVLPADMAVSIIIPTRDGHEVLRACIESLSMIGAPAYEVIIIDNGSETAQMQAYLQEVEQWPNVRVFRHDIPFNFSRLCNLGAATARYDWLLFLNDDIEAVEGGWLQALCAQLLGEGVGITGARLLYPSRDLQHAGIASHLLPGPGHPWRGVPESVWCTHPLLSRAGEVDAVTGACLLVSKDLFEQLGGFNETDFAISLNDVDLCLRAREAGYRVIYTPAATLLHKEGQTRRADDHAAEQPRRQAELAAFVRRHPEAARRSVYYPAQLPRDTDRGDG